MATCPSCGRVNPADARFCNACATLLATEAPREERKSVTVLFADLVGFTARAERMDAEEVRALLRPYHDLLRRELERYGGTVEKFIGDAVMAVFGAPVVHEDDPERAVRAALAIRDAMGDEPLEVRIGITTGEALVAVAARPEAGEGMVAGDVVNTASRVEAAAPADGILVDEGTYRASEHAIRYREHEPLVAKGKSRPIRVWEAVEARADVGVDLRRSERTPFVGRERELAALLGALERVQGRREPELVTVVGVPGLGKTRLVRELARIVDGRPALVVWRQGRSLPYGEGVSFWALSEMVKAQSGILENDPPRDAEAKLGTALASLPLADAAWVERHLRPLVGLAPADGSGRDPDRSEAFAAWRRFFEAVAEWRPTVLVFEDLHWADEGLLDFVDHLLDWAGESPLLILCTTRPELFSRRPEWAAGRANATTLALAPLTEEESHRLVRSVAGGGRADLVSLVVERSGGNPLYAEELARLASAHRLRHDAPLPATVQGIIAARLDTLTPEEKLFLQDAAVVGNAFWTEGVATVGGIARWSVEEVMHRLERKEFVHRSRRSAVAGETEYAFQHVLVRDVAYAQIPRGERADKHRLAAGWIESLSVERVEEKAEMVAHHYRAALEFARASRQDTRELTERARHAFRDAGDHAAALNAWPAAARFYREALAVWPVDDERRPRLLFAQGSAVFRAGDRAAELLEEALAELLAAGDLSSAAEAELLLGELAFWAGDRDTAFARFGRALDLVADAPPSLSKAQVLSTLSRFYAVALETEDAIRYGRQALEMAEALGLGEVRAHALNNIGFARVAHGDPAGIGDLERSIAAAEELNSPEAIRGYLNLGHNLAHLGDLRGMYEADARGRRAAERLGDAVRKEWFSAESLWELYWRGRWGEAEELAEELLAAVEPGSPRAHLEPGPRIVRAWIGLAGGRLDDALEQTSTLTEFVRGARFLQVLFPALALHAHVLAACGRHDEAWSQARELLRLWRESGVNACSYWTADLAFALARLGRNDELLQPLAAAARTRWTDAAQALAAREPQRAARMYAEIGSVPDEALARLLAADWLLARGRAEEARAELERALSFYRRVGAARYVAEGEALLAVAA